MPERSGIELFAKDEFSATFKKYDRMLAQSERGTQDAARAITKAGTAQTKSFAAVGATLGSLALEYAGVIAAAYSFQRIMSESLAIATVNQAAMQGLATSTGAAQREFGDAVGTTARWTGRVRELSDELRVYSDTAVARAITRTVDMTKRLGLSETQMVELVRRAGDLGAGKTDLTGAVERVTAALRGEAESAEYLGLTLSETYVKTNAARLGFSRAWKDMTELEKAQVRYAAFLEQTNEVLGAAAASTATLAGAQAEARKEYERAAQQLGEVLIPAKLELVKAEIKLIQVLGKAAETFKQMVAMAHAALAAGVETVKGIGQAVIDDITGKTRDFEDVWAEVAAASMKAYEETILKYVPAVAEDIEGITKPPPMEAPEPPDYEKITKAVESTLDAIGKMQRDHNLRLLREEEDAARERARAWAEYEKRVAKTIALGQKRLAKLTANYERDRAKAIADYGKRVAQVERDVQRDRLRAQRNFELRERQSRQRFQLTQIQSERRYQFERNRLIAEGDTLAIEQLDERYKLEQEEAAENERLRQQQAREGQAAQIREAGEAAREQLRELEQQLHEQLREQEINYQEQIEAQRQANAERLIEMATDFAERQRLEDEDRNIAMQRREEDYRRQLEELGMSLSDQLREHEYGAENVARILQQYYGPGGVADQILAGYHEREATRIAITEQMLQRMGQAAPTMPLAAPERGPWGVAWMQQGGVISGPALVGIEAGMTEAIIPLSQTGGGIFEHRWANPLTIQGLEQANPANVDALAQALVAQMTSSIRTRRRS